MSPYLESNDKACMVARQLPSSDSRLHLQPQTWWSLVCGFGNIFIPGKHGKECLSTKWAHVSTVAKPLSVRRYPSSQCKFEHQGLFQKLGVPDVTMQLSQQRNLLQGCGLIMLQHSTIQRTTQGFCFVGSTVGCFRMPS